MTDDFWDFEFEPAGRGVQIYDNVVVIDYGVEILSDMPRELRQVGLATSSGCELGGSGGPDALGALCLKDQA